MQSPNEVATFLKNAHANLIKAEKALLLDGCKSAAEIIVSERVRLETIIQVHIADLAETKAPALMKRDPLEDAIYSLWMEKHPAYGRPDDRDRVAVRQMLRDVVRIVYKQANSVFIENAIDNFDNSTAKWIVENRTLAVFAKHFRKFVQSPVIDFNSMPSISNRDSLQSVFAKR